MRKIGARGVKLKYEARSAKCEVRNVKCGVRKQKRMRMCITDAYAYSAERKQKAESRKQNPERKKQTIYIKK